MCVCVSVCVFRGGCLEKRKSLQILFLSIPLFLLQMVYVCVCVCVYVCLCVFKGCVLGYRVDIQQAVNAVFVYAGSMVIYADAWPSPSISIAYVILRLLLHEFST